MSGIYLSFYYQDLKEKSSPFVLTMDLKVVPKARPRMGKHAVYTPRRTLECEKAIYEAAQPLVKERMTYPVYVDLVFTTAFPKSFKGWKLEAAKQGLIVPSKGDYDNMAKTVCDALNGLVYYDDVQITEANIRKRYGPKDGFSVVIERAGLSDVEVQKFIQQQP